MVHKRFSYCFERFWECSYVTLCIVRTQKRFHELVASLLRSDLRRRSAINRFSIQPVVRFTLPDLNHVCKGSQVNVKTQTAENIIIPYNKSRQTEKARIAPGGTPGGCEASAVCRASYYKKFLSSLNCTKDVLGIIAYIIFFGPYFAWFR